MAMTKLSAPWVRHYRELCALFAKDPDVSVVYNEMDNEVVLYVVDERKAEALTQIVLPIKEFGNVTLHIYVRPANGAENMPVPQNVDAYNDAFDGNYAVNSVQVVEEFGGEFTYVVFAREVVQYFNDDIGDIHGVCSTLYENIARDVLNCEDGVFFCTNISDPSLGKYRDT